MHVLPCAEYLNNEQVNYELTIRGRFDGFTQGLDLIGKQQVLRTYFRADIEKRKNYPSPYVFADEFPIIEIAMNEISKALSTGGLSVKIEARLLHYWYRTKRSNAANEEDKAKRREMVRRIEDHMGEFGIKPPSPAKDKINKVLKKPEPVPEHKEEEEEENARGGPIVQNNGDNVPKRFSTPENLNRGNGFGTGALKKTNVTNPEAEPEVMDAKVERLEEMLTRLAALVFDKNEPEKTVPQTGTAKPTLPNPKPQLDSDNSLAMKKPDRLRVRKSGLFSPVVEVSSSSDESSPGEQKKAASLSGAPRGRGRPTLEDDGNSLYDGVDSEFSLSSRRRGRRGRQRDWRDERDHIYRVEKWKLKFTGDSRVMSIENFLYKLKKIAQREGISNSQLLNDVHILLEGHASDWFYTFVDEFDTWETFEKLIRFTYGNPNQDQGIRVKIQERKQQRGESFIAFASDVEKLNKMLSKPLSAHRKFETIWENMRYSYRSKLSYVKVRDLHHLTKLCHRIDAVDQGLHQSWEPHQRRGVNNVEVEESDEETDESADVNAVRAQHNRDREGRFSGSTNQRQQRYQQQQSMERRQPSSNQPAHPPTQQGSSGAAGAADYSICWNCDQEGHTWRECSRPRVVFCYGCGYLGRTIRSCERCASTSQQSHSQRESGNQQGN